MRRRLRVFVLGIAVAWPAAAGAQPDARIIGTLSPASPETTVEDFAAFRQGLAESGFAVGRDIAIADRWARGAADRLPALAADLVARKAALIVTAGTVATAAAKAATATIPIVFVNGDDPVTFGLVASLNRPGGNLTGITLYNSPLVAKRFGLLRELLPDAKVIGLLANPDNPNIEEITRTLAEAVRAGGGQLVVERVSGAGQFEAAFAALAARDAMVLVVGDDRFLVSQRAAIVALAARHRLPAIYNVPDYVKAGGLMSYGSRPTDAFHAAGLYAGRILKGEAPGSLPVQLATTFTFAINLKTAKALGLTVPPSLLARADEVIE
jgi:putative ABC transport system substrate-binding protein